MRDAAYLLSEIKHQISALMPRSEAVKMLHEQDLSVYGDGKFPIEDYLAVITKKADMVSFADYLQVTHFYFFNTLYSDRLIDKQIFILQMYGLTSKLGI